MKYQYLFPIIPALRGILARPNETRPRFAFTRDGVVGQEGNMLFLVTPNGKTKYITENNSRLPIEGTRYPEQWLMWHIINFVKANPNRLIFFLLFLVLLAVGNAMALYLPANSNPFGEQTLWLYSTTSKVVFFAVYGFIVVVCVMLLIAAFLGPTVAWGRDNWKKAMQPKTEEESLLIEAGNPLAPDYLIDSASPDETAKQFFDRVAECRRANGEHCFVIAVPFGEDKFIICHPAPADSPTSEEVAGVRAAYVHGTIKADGETWEEYKHFLSRVRQPLKDYCFEQRAKTPGIGALSALSAQMKGAVVAVLILCFVVPGVAQSKTQRLYNYLGTRAETIVPHDDTQVEFAFEGATLTRTGDGRTNLVNLMQKMRLFTDDDNAGALREVKINGEVLPPIKGSEKPQVVKTNYTVGEGSAVPVDGEPRKVGLWASLPDSTELARMERGADAAIIQTGKELMPRWGFMVRMFWKIAVPILFLIMLVCYFIAKSAFTEMGHSNGIATVLFRPISFWGYGARNGVFLCAILIGAVTLVDGAVSDFFAGNGLWWWFAVSAVKMWVIYLVVTWATPNPPRSHKLQNFNGPMGQQLLNG